MLMGFLVSCAHWHGPLYGRPKHALGKIKPSSGLARQLQHTKRLKGCHVVRSILLCVVL